MIEDSFGWRHIRLVDASNNCVQVSQVSSSKRIFAKQYVQSGIPFYELEVPEIDIQNKIVRILSLYDDLIENNQKQIRLLEEAAQRLFKEWFVEFRFPEHEDIEIVDGVPKGWTTVPLSEIADVVMGQSPKSD